VKIARWLVALALLVSFVRPASADDRARARAAFRAGSQHYNLGEFQQALDAFKEAYRRYEDPSFLFNIAQCERQLDHKQEAIRFYRQYLADAKDATNRDEVQGIIAKLQAALDQEHAAAAAKAAQPAPEPPPATTAPPPSTTSNAATLTASAPPPEKKTPVYKKWWLWTAVGVVAVGVGVGLGVGLGTSSSGSLPSTTFGSAKPF
jgi:tetratricopeptide (TPR) repeat protein